MLVNWKECKWFMIDKKEDVAYDDGATQYTWKAQSSTFIWHKKHQYLTMAQEN